jgi:hypothetical protein
MDIIHGIYSRNLFTEFIHGIYSQNFLCLSSCERRGYATAGEYINLLHTLDLRKAYVKSLKAILSCRK